MNKIIQSDRLLVFGELISFHIFLHVVTPKRNPKCHYAFREFRSSIFEDEQRFSKVVLNTLECESFFCRLFGDFAKLQTEYKMINFPLEFRSSNPKKAKKKITFI